MAGIPWGGSPEEKAAQTAKWDRKVALKTQQLDAAHDWLDAHDWPPIDRELRIEVMVGKRMRTIRVRPADQVKAPGYVIVYNLRGTVLGLTRKGASRETPGSMRRALKPPPST